MKRHVLVVLCLLSFTLAYEPVSRREIDYQNEQAVMTDDWAMELTPETDPHWFAEKHGYTYFGRVANLPNMHHFRRNPTTVVGESHPHPARSANVYWSQQQSARRLMKRTMSFADPLYGEQWHLHNNSRGFMHLNLEEAWKSGFNGAGVTIAVVDDGVEYTHPDLRANYRPEGSWDINFNDSNPYPDSSRDDHGTSAAGAAAAGTNGACGVGTAYGAGISALRILSRTTTDIDEAAAMAFRPDINHIYTNSWGPIDDGRRKEGPGPLSRAAVETNILHGRNGKGSIYVWAGGNGRRSGDNCNYDGWANSRYTITIAAVTSRGTQAWYSEDCAMLLGSAPSSGDSASITTTDLMGSRGTNAGDCTSGFGGTSAAAPLIAGVVAVILQANPDLTWRDVQRVMINTCDNSVDSTDSSWQRTQSGLKHSHKYGFGLIDLSAAVRLARNNYQMLPPVVNASREIRTNLPITDLTAMQFSIDESFSVEHVDIYFEALVQMRGNLVIKLQSPFGTTSVLAEKHGDRNQDYNWRFGSIAHWGEKSDGVWKLIVEDTSNSGAVITGATLVIHGHYDA